MDLIFATHNENKLLEVKKILSNSIFNLISLNDLKIYEDIIEDGKTYAENALIKAKKIGKLLNKITLAEDSGLEIDFLNKFPGIYSARFLGENITNIEKNKILLQILENVPNNKRTARFICNSVVYFPNGSFLASEGKIEGYIADKLIGENGFGYDPIFFIPEYNVTMAELDSSLKNKISHRALAFKKIEEMLLEAIK